MNPCEEDEADIAADVGVKTAARGDDAAVEAWSDRATGDTEPCIDTPFCDWKVDCNGSGPGGLVDMKEALQPDAQ